MPETTLTIVSEQYDNDALADIIFVHGLGGDTVDTWQREDNNNYFWPRWLADELPYVNVYTLGYPAAATKWTIRGSAMPLPDRATNVLGFLVGHDFRIGQRPVIFVAHSLGGLLVKQILRKASDSVDSQWECLVLNTKGVVFLATPHSGSSLANLVKALKVIRPSHATNDLKAHCPHLRDLGEWYRQNTVKLGIATKAFFETNKVSKFKIFGTMVVNPTSANPAVVGCIPEPADGDHFTICKPKSHQSPVYVGVRAFIRDSLERLFDEESESDEGSKKANIRNSEIADLCSQIRNSPMPDNSIRIFGPPGLGKTWFAFHLVDELARGSRVLYIPRGVESDIGCITEMLQNKLATKWRKVLEESGHSTPDDLEENEFYEKAAEAFCANGTPIIIEAGEIFKPNDNSFVNLLVNKAKNTNNGSMVILTAYASMSDEQKFDIQHELKPLSFRDSILLIKHFSDTTIDICKTVHERFKGHTLSIASWAKNHSICDLDESGIGIALPEDTRILFQNIWKRLSPNARKLWSGIMDEPTLAYDEVIRSPELEELINTGMLNYYPHDQVSKTQVYVHLLAEESCKELLPKADREVARLELLQKAVDEGNCDAELKLVSLLVSKDKKEAAKILLESGREWLEVAGLRNARKVLSNISMHFDAGSNAYAYCKYLEAISLLFSGHYDDALLQFQSILKWADDVSEEFALAIKAETMECFRRIGEVDKMLQYFTDIYSRCISFNDLSGVMANHFVGVVNFLCGHLLRTFGLHRYAYEAYDRAERSFATSYTRNNLAERAHCLYAKSKCLYGSYQATNGGLGFGDIVIGRRSSFLYGLACLVQCKNHVLAEQYDAALTKAAAAKDAFEQFASIAYYQRACCFEAIVNILAGNKRVAENSISEIRNPITFGITVVSTVIRNLCQGNVIDESDLSEKCTTLLSAGHYGTVFTLLKLLETQLLMPVPGRGEFVVSTLRNNNGKWLIEKQSYSLLSELTVGLSTLFGWDSINQPVLSLD